MQFSDLVRLSCTRFNDRYWLCLMCRYIDALVDTEVATGVSPERVVVGGLSQGGAAALFFMRRATRKIAGYMGA
jgi:predicted esterase